MTTIEDKQPRWIEYVRPDELPPDPVNPKDHDIALIRRSIVELGFIEPTVLDERTGQLISGHGRREALVQTESEWEKDAPPPDGIMIDAVGRWLVPLSRGWASDSEEHAKAALIVLNRAGEKGGYVVDRLSQLLAELDASRLDLTLTGYNRDDLDAMLASLTPPTFAPDEADPARLDTRSFVVCPNCSHEIDPSTAVRVER